MEKFELIAPCHFGLEAVMKREILDLGYEITSVEDGKVTFEGDAEAIAYANVFLRTTERILLKIGQFRAETFEELFEKTKALPWERYIPKDGKFWVTKANSIKSKLFSPRDFQTIVQKAVVSRLQKAWHREGQRLPMDGPEFPLRVSAYKDRILIGIDSSGESLHKRGYRRFTVKAPVTETLASALIMLTPWHRDRILVDPFCGSGTIAIEAAQIACNMAPGLNRSFAFEKLNIFDLQEWQEMKEDAKAEINLHAPVQIRGSDISSIVVSKAQANAQRAGLQALLDDGRLVLTQGDARQVSAFSDKGFIVTNPPYGEQSNPKSATVASMMKNVADNLKKSFSGWTAWMLTSDRKLPSQMRLSESRKIVIFNGPLECRFFKFEMVKGSFRNKKEDSETA